MAKEASSESIIWTGEWSNKEMINQTIKFDNHLKDINKYGHNKYPHKIGVFVINLKKRSDRLKNIEDQLRGIGIDGYEIIEAIDGYALSDNEVHSEVNLSVMESVFKKIYMEKPEIGCSMSHNIIYKKIMAENYSHAIVLEDDVVFHEGAGQFLNHIINNKIELVFDALLFGYQRPEIIKTKDVQQSIGGLDLRVFEHSKDNYLEIWGTHAYVISNRGARKALSFNDKVLMRADNIWNIFLDSFEIFATGKVLANAYSFNSDIDSRAEQYWDVRILGRGV
jgi:glycosyl transferase family 25